MSNSNGKFVNGAWIEMYQDLPMTQVDRIQCEFIQFVNYVNDIVASHNELIKTVTTLATIVNDFTDRVKHLEQKES